MKTLGVIIWMLVSLNIFVFAVPLITEMIQQSTWFSAGLFNKHVYNGDEETYKKVFLDKEGNYHAFGFGVTFIIAIISISLGILIGGDIFNKLLAVDFQGIKSNADLVTIGVLLSGFICAVNIGFFLSVLAHSSQSVFYTIKDIIGPRGLIDKILKSDDAVSIFIRGELPVSSIKSLEKNRESMFMGKVYLTGALNKILKGKSIYLEERFANIQLPEETKKLIEKNPAGIELSFLNRKLLELTYPEHFVVYELDERAKTAEINIDLMEKALKDSEINVNIKATKGFYVNINEVEGEIIQEDATIPEEMQSCETDENQSRETGKIQ